MTWHVGDSFVANVPLWGAILAVCKGIRELSTLLKLPFKKGLFKKLLKIDK